MKLRFQRVKSFIGFSLSMKIIIDGELVYKLKNGEVFEYEKDKIDSLLIKTHRFIFDLEIPLDLIEENADILLDYQLGLCRNITQSAVFRDYSLSDISGIMQKYHSSYSL
ncbi:MAG TPA: hypothetical protein PK160_00365 [Bacillota bacterium]|nr:hypothetical protein [Bacillota bacterium]